MLRVRSGGCRAPAAEHPLGADFVFAAPHICRSRLLESGAPNAGAGSARPCPPGAPPLSGAASFSAPGFRACGLLGSGFRCSASVSAPALWCGLRHILAPSSESRRHVDGWAVAKPCLVACAMPGVGHGGPSQRGTRTPGHLQPRDAVVVDDTDQSLAVDGGCGCCRSPSALSRRSRRTWSWRMCGSAAWTVAGSPLWSRWIVKAGRDGEGDDLSYETHHTRPSTV